MADKLKEIILKELMTDKEFSEMWHNLKKKRIGHMKRYLLDNGSPGGKELFSRVLYGLTGDSNTIEFFTNMLKNKILKKIKIEMAEPIDEKEFGLSFDETKDIMMEG